jgi:hypothetical protein
MDMAVDLASLCREYAVQIPAGFDGTELVRIWKEGRDWHIGTPPGVDPEGIENMVDALWAPVDYQQAMDIWLEAKNG